MTREEQHLIECLRKIKANIHRLEIQLQAAENESQELFRAVRSGDTELYSQLMVSINMKNHYEKSLHKNHTALDKPYFGRIDYKELDSGQNENLYIGKNGITMGDHEVTVVDWRAPAATIYYENPMGKGSYQAIDETPIPIDLHLKRTFDIAEGKLLGYYDSDVAANDELLVKYLSQNKEAVLGDIISTIQKEQNEIIRETPYADILVQGVAGSGKTTVAMHRISYILYNYGKRFAPEEFCIIAASDMLLRYITSGLPELDVENVRQMTMVHFLIQLLSNEWKKNYEYIQPDPGECCKSHISFIKALDKYLGDIRTKVIPHQDITDTDAGILMYGSDISEILDRNPEKSVSALCSFLNERLISRIRMLLSEDDQKDLKSAMLKKHKKFFTWKKNTKAVQVYIDFLFSYAEEQSCPTCMDSIIAHVQKGKFDVYDLAAMTLIYIRLLSPEKCEDFSQIIVDEAQDFGPSVYYALSRALPGCRFTIMGDISQNIHYETGMNSWDSLRQEVFGTKRTKFHVLAKSYRNTIEISEYAGYVLRKASAGAYRIQPVIRHGKPVKIWKTGNENMSAGNTLKAMVSLTLTLLEDIRHSGFDTTAVICRDEAEAQTTAELLGIEKSYTGQDNFHTGVMVLPVMYTKGLEFDTVILWDPSPAKYQKREGDAKLLYVAITRALHELHIVCHSILTPLLMDT